MSFRLFIQNTSSAGVSFGGVIIGAVLAMVAADSSLAGTKELPPVSTPRTPSVRAQSPSTPTIVKAGHLVVIGPATISRKPVAGPRVRQPPLLQAPKIASSGRDGVTKSATLNELNEPKTPEPSALAPDASPLLLPADNPPVAAKPIEKSAPTESVLVPLNRGELELKDAVVFFETPAGPGGSQVALPVLVPFSSPRPATQPASRATYREEK